MPAYWPILFVALLAIGLLLWSVLSQRRKDRDQKAALEQLGFAPCPNEKSWLEGLVTRLEQNRGYRYEIRDPRRLPGEPAVYYYIQVCHGGDRQEAVAEEVILFPLKRSSSAGLVLTVKPSSLAPGLATRLIGAVATGPWDAQPDDLQRLELPLDLKDTNLLAALGPPGASLYDLVDSKTLSVVQGLGDAGGMFVRFREAWCSVANTHWQVPFRLNELIPRIRPLL